MSEQINVESIMKEIKKEIEVKGYTNDLLSFDDVIVDVGSMNVNKFDKVKFNEDIYCLLYTSYCIYSCRRSSV